MRVLRGASRMSEGLPAFDAGASPARRHCRPPRHQLCPQRSRSSSGVDKKHATQFFPTLQSLVRNGRPQGGRRRDRFISLRSAIASIAFSIELRDSDVRFQLDLHCDLMPFFLPRSNFLPPTHPRTYQSWLLFFRPNNERRSEGLQLSMQTGVLALRHQIIDWHTNLKMPASNEAEFTVELSQHMREIPPVRRCRHGRAVRHHIEFSAPQSVPKFAAEHVRRHRGRAIGLARSRRTKGGSSEHAIRDSPARPQCCRSWRLDPWCPVGGLYEVCNRLKKCRSCGTSPPLCAMPCMNMAIRPSSIGSPAPSRT